MKLEFDSDKAQILMQLIDVAAKSLGLQGARACVYFADLIEQAAKAEQQPKTDPPEINS